MLIGATVVASLLAPPADPKATVDAVARPYVEDGTCVGLAIGVIVGDESHVYGYGEVEKGGGQTPDGSTLYEIGSISKTFTGLLLADMAGRGLVRLDQPVAELLPDTVTAPSRGDRVITLLDLSTHTSGLPRLPTNFRPADGNNPYADYSVEDLYEFLSTYRLPREPGRQLSYSNYGVGLLGHALALKAGTSYEQLLRDRICTPLGMDDTVIVVTDALRPRFAPGYAEGGASAHHWDIPTLAGAGAIRSTVDDMLRFLRANVDPDVTPLAAAIRAAHQVRYEGSGQSIGLGWFVGPDAPSVRWHNGGTGGFHTFAGFDSDRRVAVVVLCNTATFAVDRLGFDLLEALREHAGCDGEQAKVVAPTPIPD